MIQKNSLFYTALFMIFSFSQGAWAGIKCAGYEVQTNELLELKVNENLKQIEYSLPLSTYRGLHILNIQSQNQVLIQSEVPTYGGMLRVTGDLQLNVKNLPEGRNAIFTEKIFRSPRQTPTRIFNLTCQKSS